MSATVSQLFVYPVKSLRGIALNQVRLGAWGFQWDRHWMLVDEGGGFITQRKYHKMILIQQAITDTHLVLSKTGMPDLCIELEYKTNAEPFTAKIWRDSCEVVDEGKRASEWLSQAIESPQPVSLVRMAHGHRRPQSKPTLLGEETSTLFADAAPFLICNQQSLQCLNESMIKQGYEAVTMENFRPNIVLNNIAAFDEHKIQELKHERYSFKHAYPCQRCIMPTVNITTGELHPHQQPFSLISELNSMPDKPRAPAFGGNAILLNGSDQFIKIGDQLSAIYKD